MYSYALLSTSDALGKSFILKELVDCQLPALSWYLLCKETVLYSVSSPFWVTPAFFHTVALITPVLNLFSGILPIVSVFIYIASFAVRILFQTSLSYELVR